SFGNVSGVFVRDLGLLLPARFTMRSAAIAGCRLVFPERFPGWSGATGRASRKRVGKARCQSSIGTLGLRRLTVVSRTGKRGRHGDHCRGAVTLAGAMEQPLGASLTLLSAFELTWDGAIRDCCRCRRSAF